MSLMRAGEGWDRRRFLSVVALWGCGVWAGCGQEAQPADDEREDDFEGWIRIELTEYPELLQPGGWAAIERSDDLFNGLIVCESPGSYMAAWRICTHGACALEVRRLSQGLGYWCPCHGSEFGLDGGVNKGPATIALKTFEIKRRGDVLWINRSL